MCSWRGEGEVLPTRKSPSALPSSPGNERLITKIILAILAPNSFADHVPTSGRRWVNSSHLGEKGARHLPLSR